jgi:putative methionine-R-sulfoxide reductase with GAF domain
VKKIFSNKTISALAFILSILFILIIFSQVRNIQMSTEVIDFPSSVYVLISLLIITNTMLFIPALSRSAEKIKPSESMEKEVTTEKEHEKEVENEDAGQENIEEIDIDRYVKELIPKDNVEKNLEQYSEEFLLNVSKNMEIVQGLSFFKKPDDELFKISGKYAFVEETAPSDFKIGETLPGQVAKDQKLLNVNNIPKDYILVYSGLGDAYPSNLMIVPVIYDEKTIGIFELASFKEFSKNDEKIISETINKIASEIHNKLMA